jgi:hypothetical protein
MTTPWTPRAAGASGTSKPSRCATRSTRPGRGRPPCGSASPTTTRCVTDPTERRSTSGRHRKTSRRSTSRSTRCAPSAHAPPDCGSEVNADAVTKRRLGRQRHGSRRTRTSPPSPTPGHTPCRPPTTPSAVGDPVLTIRASGRSRPAAMGRRAARDRDARRAFGCALDTEDSHRRRGGRHGLAFPTRHGDRAPRVVPTAAWLMSATRARPHLWVPAA